MQKIIGIICLVGGVLLLVWARNIAQSVGGQFQQVFTGSPGDKPMWLYVVGAVLAAAGVLLILMAKKKQ